MSGRDLTAAGHDGLEPYPCGDVRVGAPVAWHDRPLVRRGLLLAVLVAALTLRLWNVNWDRDQHLNPDERYWAIVTSDISADTGLGSYLDSADSTLNPYNHRSSWVYGTGPLLLNKAMASWLEAGVNEDRVPADWIARGVDRVGIDLVDDGRATFDDRYDSHVIGRLLSALFDTATIVVAYLVARRLFDTPTALLASVLLATAVLHIQYSHMYGAETIAAFFVTVTAYGAVRLASGSAGWKTVAFTGLALGLAVAAKLNGIVVVPAVLVAALLWSWRAPGTQPVTAGARLVRAAAGLEKLLVAGLAAIVAFRFAQPYAFEGGLSLRLDERFVADMTQLARIQSGIDFPPSVQWIDRTPLLYPVGQLFRWGLGPPVALAAVVGLGFGAVALVRSRGRASGLAIPITLVASMLLLVGTRRTPTLRYLLPIYPMLAVMAGHGLVRLWRHRPALPRGSGGLGAAVRRQWLRAVVLTTVALGVLWGLAFTAGVYGRTHSRIEASEWMSANIPAGAAVSYQEWDDALPLRLPSLGDYRVETVTFRPYVPDSAVKVADLVQALDQVDYVVESSNRLYDSIPRVPARYPSTIAYYEALFDGRLGFDLVAEFSNPPALFGVEIDDSGAEEAFSVYDHPTVRIWEKTDEYDSRRALAIIDIDRAASAIDVIPRDSDENALLLRPAEYRAQQRGGTFSDVFGDGTGLTSWWPWLWWLAFLQVAAIASVPWVTWVFARLPGCGYGFSKPLGLLAVVVPLWLVVSWGLADSSRTLIWSWFTVLVALGAWLGFRRRDALRSQLSRHRRSWAVAEATFVGSFVLMVLLRAANPDLWHPFRGGEKPMELAYLTAVSRSTTLPPYDPWFAGGSMNYPYFGYYILSVPIRALRILPEVAFNLGLATYAALAAVVAFTIVHGLVTGTRPVPAVSGRGALLAGVGGVALLLLVGNLASMRQHIARLRGANPWAGVEGVPLIGPVLETFGGVWEWVRGGPLAPFDWWAPSRVNEGNLDITEFPAWSFLFGDLHPHVMDIAILGLVVGIGAGYVCSVVDGDRARARALLVLLGVTTGLVRMVNTWDLPASLILAAGALAVGQAMAAGSGRQRLLQLGRDLVGVGAVHLLMIRPYVDRERIADDGLGATPATTPFDGFVTQFGFFLVLAGAYAVVRFLEPGGPDAGARVRHLRSSAWRVPIVVSTAALALVFALRWGPVAAVSVVVAWIFLLLMVSEVRRPEPMPAFVAGLFALAFTILAGVELVVFENDIERLNTVFKFWYQAWLFAALAGAYALWHVGATVGHLARQPSGDATGRVVRTVWLTGVTCLLVSGLSFGLLATPERLDDRFSILPLQLDGLAYLENGAVVSTQSGPVDLGGDLPLIEWLRDNVSGSPTIVEAVGPLYQWPGRISINTGLPAVVGWDHHQRQQRQDFSAAVDRRRADTEGFWAIAERASIEAFLRRYDVSYVVVGVEERRIADPRMLELLDSTAALEPVFRWGELAVYEVDKWALRGLDRSVALGPLIADTGGD